MGDRGRAGAVDHGQLSPGGGREVRKFCGRLRRTRDGPTLAIVPEKQLFSGKFDKNTKWREALVPFSSYAK